MYKWQRPRKPSRLRYWGYVGTTALKCGTKLLTKMGLRLHLHLGGQRVYTTPPPPAIQESVPPSSRTDTASEVAEAGKDSTAKVLTSSSTPSKVAEQPKGIEKEKSSNQGVALDAKKPPIATQDPSAEKEVSNKMEIVLTFLPLPAKADPMSKGPEASETTFTQPNKAPPKEKLVIKKK